MFFDANESGVVVLFSLPPNNRNGTQTFQLSVVTSYVPLQEQELDEYIPPSPPALFKLPYDVFYPFTTATSNAAPSSLSLRRASASTLAIFSALLLMVGSLTASFGSR